MLAEADFSAVARKGLLTLTPGLVYLVRTGGGGVGAGGLLRVTHRTK